MPLGFEIPRYVAYFDFLTCSDIVLTYLKYVLGNKYVLPPRNLDFFCLIKEELKIETILAILFIVGAVENSVFSIIYEFSYSLDSENALTTV